MSKAFTRENDHTEENEGAEAAPNAGLPLGAKNYMTPGCAKRMQEELKQLRYIERPEVTKIVSWAAGNGDRSENGDYTYNKRRLRVIDKRMRYLSKRLAQAEVIDPSTIVSETVRFGATVTVRDEDDVENTYSIVGVDEVDLAKRRISWVSPLGAALLKGRLGDLITFRTPRGTREIEIIAIKYIPVD